ncbi:MAG: EAL domain-containing protein [Geobacter sp.]|nr:EAL domain-containing protein [Geobacter sp.]
MIEGLLQPLDALLSSTAHPGDESLEDICVRNALVARTRWVLLVLVALYSLLAAGLYSFSIYGLFLIPVQKATLIGSLLAVASYNLVLERWHKRFRHHRFVTVLQIFLDMVFVTILIHFSGGGVSWFWPVYLVVTLESAFLMDKRRDVLLLVGTGSLMYGGLLYAEYLELLPHVVMPFVDERLHHDPLYNVLTWLWVVVLNFTVALIGVFLMSVIRRDRQALRNSEERLLNFVDSANDLIHSCSPDGRILYANRAWQKTLGYGGDEISGLTFSDILNPESEAECMAEFRKALDGGPVKAVEAGFVSKEGGVVSAEVNISCGFKDGKPSVVWGICRDITERKQAQEQLYRLAHHDTLTGLPNRILFLDRLKNARALARRQGFKASVLFLDLDRFKIINDTLGHTVGDKLLQQVAKRLLGCVRETDTVARIGGDEFTVVLVNVGSEADVERIADKILKAMAIPFKVDEHELFVTSSIGISIYPEQGDDAETLLKKADIAMYEAKTRGRNNFQFYTPALDANASKKLHLGNDLRKAMERDEFILHYQPKFDIASGKVTALEALVRWEHPEHGLLPPADFIPLAEEMGLIVPLGEWVLRTACRQNAEWRKEGMKPLRIAVNLSALQFRQNDLPEIIRGAVAESGLEPELLELEITESIIVQDPETAVDILNELREMGIYISVDDFGTGYSSLLHIKRFPVDTLKIDKSFVRNVDKCSTDGAIAQAIITMGTSLDIKVIAEGVETEGELAFLKENHCDEAQGFLLSVPLPAGEIPGFLSRTEAALASTSD